MAPTHPPPLIHHQPPTPHPSPSHHPHFPPPPRHPNRPTEPCPAKPTKVSTRNRAFGSAYKELHVGGERYSESPKPGSCEETQTLLQPLSISDQPSSALPPERMYYDELVSWRHWKRIRLWLLESMCKIHEYGPTDSFPGHFSSLISSVPVSFSLCVSLCSPEKTAQPRNKKTFTPPTQLTQRSSSSTILYSTCSCMHPFPNPCYLSFVS